MSTTRLMTADELLSLPHRDEHGNECRLELVRGELRKLPLNGAVHGMLCATLATRLSEFVKVNRSGVVFGTGTGFIVERNPDTVLGIDVSFVSRARLQVVEDLEKFVPFAPDLAVEVLSLEDTVYEIDEKIVLYFAAGAQAVWIFNPKHKTVAVYTSPLDVRILGENDTLEGGDVLPGFSYELSKLFAVKR